MPISPENLYMQLRELVAGIPEFPRYQVPIDAQSERWLGRAHALVSSTGDMEDAKELKLAVRLLYTSARPSGAQTLTTILYRALAFAELNAPSTVQGAFIPAGNAFDAMAMVGKVLQEAKQSLLMVDPYMDEKVLTDFAGLAPAGVILHLMADQQSHKQTLKPAVSRWMTQHGSVRPIEARLAPSRSLHDRLIVVDGVGAWTLTQSFNALAARSPASIVRVDAETAALKTAAYEAMWQAAVPL